MHEEQETSTILCQEECACSGSLIGDSQSATERRDIPIQFYSVQCKQQGSNIGFVERHHRQQTALYLPFAILLQLILVFITTNGFCASIMRKGFPKDQNTPRRSMK